MKKGIMALEGLDQDTDEVADTGETVPAEALELAEVSNEVEVQSAQIEEASDAIDTIQGFIEILQAKVEPEAPAAEPEGVDETTAEVLDKAMESLYIRLGFTKKPSFPALESFTTKESKLQASKLALESMRLTKSKIENQITIAQEGLFGKVKNKFELLFTNADKLSKSLSEASAAFDASGPKENLIVNPDFAKAFGEFKGELVTGKEVVAKVVDFEKQFNGEKIAKTMADLGKLVDSVFSTLKKTNIFSHNEETAKDIAAFKIEIQKVTSAFLSEYEVPNSVKTKHNFVALTKEDKEKIVKTLKASLSNKKLEEELRKTWYQTVNTFFESPQAFSEIRDNSINARRALDPAMDVMMIISDMISTNLKLAQAARLYIVASTAK